MGRLFYWQIIQGPSLYLKAISQTLKPEKVNPIRGTIYDSNNYPLAFSSRYFQLSLYKPNLKKDLTNIINEINSTHPNLSQKDQNLLSKFKDNSDQKWITLSDLFSYTDTKNLTDPGISYVEIDKRLYPEENLARSLLGYLTTNNDGTTRGISGLESFYQKQLAGKTGYLWSTKDATGKTIINKRSWQDSVQNGIDLHTSINRSIQHLVEKTLKEGVINFQADSGSISLMEPNTGQIIAMANFQNIATASATKIIPIADLFEPGSIFKPLVVTMALDSNSINTDFVCTKCNSSRTIGQYTITNWDNELHPNSSLQDIIKNSDNIGMSYVIDQLGLKSFLKYFSKLNLDSKSNIDLPGESYPLSKNYWPDIDFATASFGQGFAVNQIQMLSAFNSLATGGTYHPPRIAKSTKIDSSIIFKTETVNKIKDILQYSVENGAVAKLRPKGLKVCAKSGTAQVSVQGSYVESGTIASYIGFSPCLNPKFTMIVTINNPKSSPWGSSTAAPIWYDLAEKISYLL
ncbi:penicillin-binding protein 2 [Candidatus Shapirobacteria bacterium]|nr:penicillin-binding protein 2 [Candidatus Shapirobacteria bacterium]